jgi:O-antigen/teichoic acid export membrane protein
MVSISRRLTTPVVTNSLALLLLRGTTIGARFVILFLLAKSTDPANYGAIIFALSVVEIARYFADLGVDTYSIRKFATISDLDTQSFIGTLTLVKSGLSIIVYIIFLFVSWISGNGQFQFVNLTLGMLIFTTLASNLVISYFQGKLQVKEIVVPITVANIISIACIIVATVTGISLYYTLLFLVGGEILSTILLFFVLRSRGFTIWFTTLNVNEISVLLKHSLPIGITAIFVAMYTRLDVLILKAFFDAETVGYYGVAYRMTEPFQLIAASFAMSVYSQMSTTLLYSKSSAISHTKQYLLAVASYGTLIGFLLFFTIPFVITWWLPNYHQSIAIAQILAITLVFRCLSSAIAAILQAHGRFSLITRIAAWNLLFISALLWFFVRENGAIGAALALLCGELVNVLIQLYFLRNQMLQLSPSTTNYP